VDAASGEHIWLLFRHWNRWLPGIQNAGLPAPCSLIFTYQPLPIICPVVKKHSNGPQILSGRQLERHREAGEQIIRLLEVKPDFKQKARMYIQRYIKEDSLVEHLQEGLQLAGLKL
jgi:hypothetical protein